MHSNQLPLPMLLLSDPLRVSQRDRSQNSMFCWQTGSIKTSESTHFPTAVADYQIMFEKFDGGIRKTHASVFPDDYQKRWHVPALVQFDLSTTALQC
jgi:hypothetical protein